MTFETQKFYENIFFSQTEGEQQQQQQRSPVFALSNRLQSREGKIRSRHQRHRTNGIGPGRLADGCWTLKVKFIQDTFQGKTIYCV